MSITVAQFSAIEDTLNRIASESILAQPGHDDGLVPAFSLLGDLRDYCAGDAALQARVAATRAALEARLDSAQPYDEATLANLRDLVEWLPGALERIRSGTTNSEPEKVTAGIRAGSAPVEKAVIAAGAQMTRDEILALIFAPGFSTAEKVTSVSGRGVGMDVVKRNIEKLRGKIEISSEVGRGSVFKIKLPLTMAIIDGLVVRVGEDQFILPSTSVQMALRPTREAISTVHGRGEVLDLRGRFVPIHRLHQRFGITADAANPWDGIVVIVETSGKTSALLVDEMISKQEVVIKNLGAFMQNLPGVSGGAILGDGNIALILDPGTLLTAA